MVMHIENFTKPHIKVLLSLSFLSILNPKIICVLDSFFTLPSRVHLGQSPKKT